MHLGIVRTAAGEPSVAVQRESNGGWVPLLTVPGADRLGPARADLLAFLKAGEQARQLAQKLAEQAPSAEPALPLLAPPFHPTAFRGCSLWEEHMIGVARGLLRLRESAVGRVADDHYALRPSTGGRGSRQERRPPATVAHRRRPRGGRYYCP